MPLVMEVSRCPWLGFWFVELGSHVLGCHSHGDKLQVRSSEVILIRDHMYVEIAASVPGWGGNKE